jgi:ubiquinone/menaquinone biosynthesis C-methylase UbiE
VDAVQLNRVFHDHECSYYDERFAIVHDARSAARARREIEALLGRPLRPSEVVLDVGCGTGWLAAGLRRAGLGRGGPAEVVGVDLSAGMLAEARAAGAWPLLQAEAERLPIAAGSVDLVVCRGVLHHLPDPRAALAAWRRVLRPSGAVVISSEPTPAAERHGAWLARAMLALLVALRRSLPAEDEFWELASIAANLHVFTPSSLASCARQAGFGQVGVRSSGFGATLVLVASYVLHGRARPLARRLPWRALEAVARRADSLVWDSVLPAGRRHTVAAVLRP